MRRVAAGDERAFEDLIGAYWHALVRYCGSVLREPDAAEDVAQETFIRVWDLRREWRPRGSLQAYLYRIARNLALNERRRLRVRARGTPAASSGGTSDPIERLERLELARTVERAIVSLPERRRQVFLLARFHDLTYAEIAESLDLSPQTVANQMSAALAQLRRLLLPALVGAVEE